MPTVATGKAGKAKLATVAVATLTSWDATVNTEFAKATDASGYDATTETLWMREEGGETSMTGSLKGNLDIGTYTTQFLARIVSGETVPLVLNIDDDNLFATCDAHLKNFKTGAVLPGATMVGFECDYSNQGTVTFGNPTP